MSETAASEKRKALRRRALTLVLFGIGVHLLLPQVTEFEKAAHALSNLRWWAVALAAVAQVLSYLAGGYMMTSLVRSKAQRLLLGRAVVIGLGASSLGSVSGGAIGTAAGEYRWLKTEGIDRVDAAIAGGIIMQLNNLMIALASVVGIAHLLAAHELTTLEVAGFAVVAGAIALAVTALVWGRRHVDALVRALDRVVGPLAKLVHRPYRRTQLDARVRSVLSVWDRRKESGWGTPLLGALLNMVFDMLTLLALFAAAGHAVPFGVLLVGYGLPLLLGKVSFLPGGVGIVEATMATLYGGLGVPSQVLVIVVLTYRLLSFWIPTAAGFVLIPILNRGRRNTVTAPQSAEGAGASGGEST